MLWHVSPSRTVPCHVRPRRFEGGRPVPYQILASDDERVLGRLSRYLGADLG